MRSPAIDTIRINGGRLCLDFINTATYPAGGPATEFLKGYGDLVTWGLRQGLIDTDFASKLRARAKASQPDAVAAVEAALSLRQALREIFEPGRPMPGRVNGIAHLNAALARDGALLSLEVTATAARFAASAGLRTWLTGAVAVSAAELLTSKSAERVQMCPGDACHWLFLDLSRNGTRRWCSMESCGNRAKVRAHYESLRRQEP